MAIALRDAAVETNGRAEASLASDASLTTSALAGDEEALGRLLTIHHGRRTTSPTAYSVERLTRKTRSRKRSS
jgi:hypothetical protein